MIDYLNFVEELAKTKTDKVFFNSGPIHAAIVMSRIFKYSNDTVRIFCGGFNGAVSGGKEYLNELDGFLCRGGKLKVCVEQDNSRDPKIKIFEVFRKHRSNVSVYLTKAKVRLKESNELIHFTTGDNSALRVETNIQDFTAEVNFKSEHASNFIKFFDEVLVEKEGQAITL